MGSFAKKRSFIGESGSVQRKRVVAHKRATNARNFPKRYFKFKMAGCRERGQF